ncbi:DNA-damage-repair/toleration protein [Ananas comosus]|uniref:DNA-damage-repair/toleration protein n=1 Tax=Ananas comosus TaxID=4615 RepID=A0A199VNA7_ANACO|nr:DNA-damage-repair/toleration protein [Ananas comosus]
MANLILSSSLLWILTVDAVVASGCMEVERNALLTFKSGLVDPQNFLSSWEGEDCCKWRGVACSNATGHVVKLNLRNRNSCYIFIEECPCLSGEINPSLLLLTNLEHLDVSMNNFSGTSIPTFLGSLKNLRYLNLANSYSSGTIPPQIGNLSKLHYLDLNSEFIYPRNLRIDDILWLTRLSSLKYLDLSIVNMNTSTVSISLDIKGEELPIWKILYLFESIDLSDNNLSGEIPDEITDLHTLQYLNLSRNNLIGHIPEKIGEMQSLESLDLAMNKLFGDIPQSLSALTFLSHLNLSYNNLSGVIPTGNQLQTLDDPFIYIGNPYLCGPPSTRNCSANEINYEDNEGPKDKFEWLWIYFGVVLGYLFEHQIFVAKK